jgi:hypothetical protein
LSWLAADFEHADPAKTHMASKAKRTMPVIIAKL